MLSRQTMLNCGAYHKMGGGCDGGDPIDVFHYMHQYGLPDESCLSYAPALPSFLLTLQPPGLNVER